MFWSPFNFKGKVYGLRHLHPKTVTYIHEAQGLKPEVRYDVKVTYSLHCFTQEAAVGENPDKALFYSDNRETRVFDFNRWRLSQELPGMIESLLNRKCYQTRRRNFLTVGMLDSESNALIQYEVYFQVTNSSKADALDLFVETAYPRAKPVQGNFRHHNKPVGFAVILKKTRERRPIPLQQ